MIHKDSTKSKATSRFLFIYASTTYKVRFQWEPSTPKAFDISTLDAVFCLNINSVQQCHCFVAIFAEWGCDCLYFNVCRYVGQMRLLVITCFYRTHLLFRQFLYCLNYLGSSGLMALSLPIDIVWLFKKHFWFVKT